MSIISIKNVILHFIDSFIAHTVTMFLIIGLLSLCILEDDCKFTKIKKNSKILVELSHQDSVQSMPKLYNKMH